MSKGAAFLTGILLVAAFGILETVMPGRNAHTMAVIGTVAAMTGAYIGLQVTNNGVRGKFFNAELFRMEHSDEDREKSP